MDWGLLLEIYGVLSGLIATVGVLLHETLNDGIQKPLKDSLRNIVRQHPRRWVRKTNVVFNRLFDRIFAAKKTAVEDAIWMGLLMSPIFLLGILGLSHLGGPPLAKTSGSLIMAILLAFGFSSGISVSRLIPRFPKTCVLALLVYIVSVVIVSPVLFPYSNVLISGFNIGLLLGLIVFGIGFGFSVLIGLMAIAGGFIVWGIAIAGVIAVLFLCFFGIAVLFSKGFQMPVRSGMALGWSIAFVAFAGTGSVFYVPNVLDSFRNELSTVGLKLFAFIAFNMFADSISLVETRYVLRWGLKARWHMLIGLLILDMLLSAAIFLFLPLVLGELPAFLEAALFRGERAWLGVLFWTTFSTSFVFYLFVLSSLVVRPLSRAPLIARHLQVETRPVLVLTLAAVIVVTVLYWGSVGVVAVVT